MTKQRKLRSTHWFGAHSKDGFIHRSWLKNQGYPSDLFDGRPVIGICNTWSELTPCNGHFRALAEHIKRGVYDAGGFPLEFPVMSTGEALVRPTAMLFRNLMSMDVEETIRANPVDGVVLITGCDKTAVGPLMGAASCNLPMIVVPGGPMLNGKFRGCDLGSGTSVWEFSEEVRAGRMSMSDFMAAEEGMSRSAGHCNTMGTASTMACMAEALGLTLPGAAAIPAVDARRNVSARLTGRRIVEMVNEELTPHKILTRAAFQNAIRTLGAISGSTNAVVHLLAIAGRIETPLTLDDFDRWGRAVPTLLDVQPAGALLMEEFYYAGGLPGVLRRLHEAGLLNPDALTANGRTLVDNSATAPVHNDAVIRRLHQPLVEEGGIAVLRGNLTPAGAILKPAAATPALLQHQGRAVVFENIEDYKQRIDDPDLPVDESSVLVLKNCGPMAYPGMAEVGNMGLPRKLLERGVRDMVRISDARMSGTAYGTVVLHAAPEAAAGGTLALVRTGDGIELDLAGRRLHLDVSDVELARRRAQWQPPRNEQRGYAQLYVDHVLQADRGVDFDFLVGCRGVEVARESH
ncbi:IlvD/Edd family dehydratase [Peristeroidobacter soli]|uniref:IlvD/Edd family dehydratase n=1 Tax=Peristeroidobacter soli TaxID=2497877 RepID=UPI00101C43D5|nr:IlvD/Edd family dehydratase [Peristeroidobacter soli]